MAGIIFSHLAKPVDVDDLAVIDYHSDHGAGLYFPFIDHRSFSKRYLFRDRAGTCQPVGCSDGNIVKMKLPRPIPGLLRVL